MSVRTGVVLAAGEGIRLRPMTRNRPKPMLPAANRPVLEHVLDALVDAGIERIVIVVGYRRARVQEYFGPAYRDVPIEYVVQEKQLGSGHALLQAAEVIDEPALVVNGDHLVEAQAVERVASTFDGDSASAAMAIIEREDASTYGAVTLADRDVERIIEKPDSTAYRRINAGIYAFQASVFEAIEETPTSEGELALTDTITRLIDEQRVRAVPIEGLWVDATYPWDLLAVASAVLERGKVPEPEVDDGVWVHDSAMVHERATLRPPVVVGADSAVGPGSVLGPEVAVGRSCTIESNVTIERAVVDADCRIGHGATLVDAVCGQDVSVGVDVTIPGGPGDVRVDNRIFEGQRLGAVLADRVRTGGAVTFEPGALVGPGARLGSGTLVRGRVGEDAEVVR